MFLRSGCGKRDHHAVALDRTGKKLLDRGLPNDEGRLRLILQVLKSHGRILLCRRPARHHRRLPVAVAPAAGVTVGYLHSSIRGDHASRRGNKALKRVLFLSAFASLKDPVCRSYYDRKRAE
ncbi:hypothetical protein QFZ79_000042 [Arthrobacter sp. V4I6]|nr:hypothetical protein [Arthrobacter sp. V1I7]MDQ0851931.1 hypothetical protein [Arthrobacter sp. V4I6]